MMKTTEYMVLVLFALIFGACENDKNTFSDSPSIYIGGDSKQNATADSVLFSFKKSDAAIQTYDLNVKVYTTGVVAPQPRTFELEVVDSVTNVSPEDYTIGKLEIPANAYSATVPVTVKRQVAGLDLSRENARLTLRVKANENFEVGTMEKEKFKLVWCDYLTQPTWWTYYGFAYYVGPFTQARYQFILSECGDVDLFEMGIVDPASGHPKDYNKLYAFVAELIELLNKYNENHPGKPYLNDNGEPLQIGTDLFE